MASLAKRRPENAPGDLFVDTTCIDCDACRWIAPATFDEAGDMSRVHRQPATPAERRRALMALVACPTASIGTEEKAADLAAARDAFPDPIEGGVHHCGYHAESSFGAASYLVVREQGNVLVDSPRFAKPLVKRIEELGGISLILLTHKDDVADHEKWAAHFGAPRMLHADDVTRSTRDVERKLEGADPIALDDELQAIPTPGHTKGHACFLWRERFLFTGDHLAWSPDRQQLIAFRRACWYDWPTLVRSMHRLAEHRFEWVLPGHGRMASFDAERMRAEMTRCLAWMETV